MIIVALVSHRLVKLVCRLLPRILTIAYLRCMKQIGGAVTAAKPVQPLAESEGLVGIVDRACRIISCGTYHLADKRSCALILMDAFRTLQGRYGPSFVVPLVLCVPV